MQETHWQKRLHEQLKTTVRQQLSADVPIAFFLSGGLDSSLLLAIARQLYPRRRFTAFTIDTGQTMQQEGFADDLPYARQVAEWLGNIDLQILPATINLPADIDHITWCMDEPQADIAPKYVYDIARQAAAQGFKVLISGAGADDVFSGYRRHQAVRLEKWLPYLPMVVRRTAALVAKWWPDTPTGRRMRKLAMAAEMPQQERLASYFWGQPPAKIRSLFHEPPFYDAYAFFSKNTLPDAAPLLQMLYWEMNGFLPHHNLNYTDKMSMAAGVETRVPYVDKDLIALVAQMPLQLRMKGSETKYLLRRVAAAYLPSSIINRSKTGFGGPLRFWVKEEMQHVIQKQLLNPFGYLSPYFNLTAISRLLSDNQNNKTDAAYTIWALLAVESWLRQFSPPVLPQDIDSPNCK
jgi:asparagine synthase (glutamine-hydrolysing)